MLIVSGICYNNEKSTDIQCDRKLYLPLRCYGIRKEGEHEKEIKESCLMMLYDKFHIKNVYYNTKARGKIYYFLY